MTAPAIVWFRRDLRLDDHPAIAAAAAGGAPVVAVFVDDPALRAVSGAPRLAALHQCLAALSDALGGALTVRRGDPVEVIPRLAAEVGADTVHVTRDHGPRGRQRDAAVAQRLRADDRHLVGVGSNLLVPPGEVHKADGTPYRVFTPYFRAWLGHLRAEPVPVPSVEWMRCASDPLPELPTLGFQMQPVTGAEASARWREFRATALDHYAEWRDRPALDGTSRLSTALKWGAVHPRTLVADIVEPDGGFARDDHRVFVSELAWRDFYADVLLQQPETAWGNLNRAMDAMPVDTDGAARERFQRWCRGTTGFPIVDAAMRQLLASGWMHNRLRMIVASFLVKDLHLPWQWGAAHFMTHLTDGDVASNSHGWQWAAGTGTDAAPYFRVFNPWTQQQRYDPDGEFVARWVPEAGTSDAIDPMVDHAAERDEALRRYRSVSGR